MHQYGCNASGLGTSVQTSGKCEKKRKLKVSPKNN